MTAAWRAAADPAGPRAWPPWARAVAGALVATSRVTLPALAYAFARDTTLDPRLLAGVAIGLGALPAAAAWLLRRAFAAEIELAADALRIRFAERALEIPRASLAGVVAWRVPLPGAGVGLRLGSGARAPVGLEPPPAALLDAFPLAHPNLAYAAARRAAPLALLRHPLVRFGLFGLVPTAALFRAQQVIGFGGLFGQYHLAGLGRWLETLAITSASTVAGLVLYASALRAPAEIAAFALAWIAPRHTRIVRAAIEWILATAYYVGVPAFLALRFLG
jgi:hypothetical protein